MTMVKADVPEDVHRLLRERRAEENSTLQDAAEQALCEWYEQQERRSAAIPDCGCEKSPTRRGNNE